MSGDLDPERREALLTDVQTQLGHAVSLGVRALAPSAGDGRRSLEITLENNVAGHRFPTGSPFFRRVWLQVAVDDAAGTRVFEIRDSDPMADPLAPEQRALLLSARLLDDAGAPTPFPWRAASLDNEAALGPREIRSIVVPLDLPPSARGPLTAQVSLRFQAFSDALLGELELDPDTSVAMEIASASCPVDGAP
jgi:hypothetical protein